MLTDFSSLVNWALASTLFLLVVLLLRQTKLTTKLSRTLCYALWLPVLLRLLIPVQMISLPIFPQLPEVGSVSEAVTEIERDNTYAYAPTVPSNQGAALTDTSPSLPSEIEDDYSYLYNNDDKTAPAQNADTLDRAALALLVWRGLALALAAVILTSNLAFAVHLRRRRVPLETASASLSVYTVDSLGSPCLVGALCPAIYLSPEDAENAEHLRHIVAHEESHYRGGDHIWSLLRAAALCLHWHNPLVWYAVVLSKRDAELACDERTLRRLGGDERTAYGETLLSLTMAKPNARDLLSCSTAMVGGKKTLRERIEGIAHSRQTRAAAAFVVIAVLALALVFAFGKQREATAYDEFLQRVEVAERIAYHPPAYSSAFYPAMTAPEIVAEAKEFLLQLELASESDVPEGELNIFMSSGFSLDGEYRYFLVDMNGVTLLYERTDGAEGVKDEDFTLIGKYASPIVTYLLNLVGAQEEQSIGIDEMDEPNAALYYEVKTTDGNSNGVDAITALLLQSTAVCSQWQETETLEQFLTIEQGGHQLYYGLSSNDLLLSSSIVDPHWFVRTTNDSSYAIFDIPAELLDTLTACFAEYDTNALRRLANLQASDISSAVLTVDGAESALADSLRDQIFDSLRTIAANEALFSEVTDAGTLRGYPVYDFFVTLTLTDGTQLTLYPVATKKGSILMSLVSETEDRRFVFNYDESSYMSSYIYRLIFSAAGVGDANDEQRGELYREASVSGSETDLNYVARAIGEQIAASWLAVPGVTVWKPEDAYLNSADVFDIYYGENGEGRNFCANLSWKLKFDSRFSADYWEAGAGLFGPDEDGYYSFGLQCLFRIGSDGRWHLADYGTGGYSVDCGIDLYHDGNFDCASLVKAFSLTAGWTHEYLLPNRFCELRASERAKLGGILDGYTTGEASNFVRAVSDHLTQYPSYHELTAESFYAELPDKYKDFAPILAVEPFWTGEVTDGRFALYDYGKTEWALLYETGDVREIVATYYRYERPDATVEASVMDDLLGFPGVVVRSDLILGVHRSFDFFAATDYGVQYVANAFGFYDKLSECVVSCDLDGDGRNELVTSNTFGGDGAHRVYAYRWSGSFAEQGEPDWSRAGVDLSRIGAMNYQESCDASRGTVTVEYVYDGSADGEMQTAELPLTMESFKWTDVGELY